MTAAAQRHHPSPTAGGDAVIFDRPEEEFYYGELDPFPVGGRHWLACIDVALPLRVWLRGKPDGARTWVGISHQIHYNRRGSCEVVIPEVAVCFGVDAAEHERSEAYRVWETRVAPAWVLEVAQYHCNYYDQMRNYPDSPHPTSDASIYAALGVAEFWRTDPTGRDMLTSPLQGYRLADGQWHPVHITADADALRGRSDVLGLDLHWRDGELRLFDPATGTWLLTHDDLLTAHLDAEARADQHAAARAAAEARAERAEAELSALRRRLDPRH